MNKTTIIDSETGEIMETTERDERPKQALAVLADTRLATPEMSLELHGQLQTALDGFVRARMKPDSHFTQIPGVDKPSLSKIGAEDLNAFFGFKHRFVDEHTTVDIDRGYIDCTVKCQIGKYAADGGFYVFSESIGSCNSYETKYRWRSKPKKKATPEEIASALRTETRTGKYGPYEVVVIENNAFDVKNTIQKMAQKRAYVGATLFATGADKHFTQDVEDMAQFNEVASYSDAAHADEQTNNGEQPPKREYKGAAKPATQSAPVGDAWLDEPLSFGKQHAQKTWRQMINDRTPNHKGDVPHAGPSYLSWMADKVNDQAVRAKARLAYEMYLNGDLEPEAEAAAPKAADPKQTRHESAKGATKKRGELRELYIEQELARRGVKKFTDLVKADQDALVAEIEGWVEADMMVSATQAAADIPDDDIPF